MKQTDSPAAMDDEDFQPISALNDLLYCERRCAMHRIEQVWVENAHTLSGTNAHKRVHAEPSREELGAKGAIVRGLWLKSQRLGLIGKADAVEFQRQNDAPGGRTAANPSRDIPFPIEYKHGRRRRWDNDDVQLCAEALCLEEMLGISVPAGAIFHVKSKRRRVVQFTDRLRELTRETARRLHELVTRGIVPPPVPKPQCQGCSLLDVCLPETMSRGDRIRRYCRNLCVLAVDEEPR